MKRHIIYTFAALALVLSCNRAEPEQQSGDLIRIGATIADVPSTKALLNKEDLQGTGTTVKIYDDLTGFTGTIDGATYNNGSLNYIDDSMEWVSDFGEDATWKFASGISWRWTRTGVHHFYGWLTTDPAGLQNNGTGTAATFNESTKVLSVPAITFTKDTPQFDFSYSDIVPVDLNSGISAPSSVKLPLKHLFTALDVEVANNTLLDIINPSVTLTNIQNGRSATINYAATPVVPVYTPVEPGEYVYKGDVELISAKPSEDSTPTQKALFSQDSFRLLWPQDWTAEGAAKSQVKLTFEYQDREVVFGPVNLPIDKMEAGKKYKIVLTLNLHGKLYIDVKVADWIEADELEYDMNLNTNIRLFDSWLYRYDTDLNYTQYNQWQTSHMVVSDGLVAAETEGDIENRPMRSPQIQLVTSGTGAFHLILDNDNFQFVHAKKENGIITSCEIVDQLDIAAGGMGVYTYFYIIPKPGATWTDANSSAHIAMLYDDPAVGTYRVAFNYNALPGYSDDSSEIWVYYFPAEYYNNTQGDKLKMYFQDSANPLVPTADQN